MYLQLRRDTSDDETSGLNEKQDQTRPTQRPSNQLFYDGDEPPKLPNLLKRKSSDEIDWGSSDKDARFLGKLRRLLGKSDEEHRKLILHMAQKMARR